MKSTLAVVALIAVGTPAVTAQIQGDSVRLRVSGSRAWTYGRLASLNDDSLTISHADSSQSHSFQSVGRFEIRRRKSVAGTLLGPVLGGLAGAGLAILTRPANRKSIFGSDGAALAVAAGVGLTIGAIDLGVNPWHWKRVRLGRRAAT
jgi:hypothetical protein